jgi:hypothetical protein
MNFIYFITPIFLSFFPILYLASSNLGERLTLGQIVGTILISGISSIISTYLFSKIFKNIPKSSILICWLIILFFSYGYLISFFSEITILEEPIGRHRYWGTLLLLITIIIFFKIYYSRKNFANLIKSILVASLVLISLNIIQIFVYYSQPRTEILETLNLEELKTNYSNEDKPDVYHIILDMYPSQKILETRFNFDNSIFLEHTEKLGFINLNGRSNYIRTKHSIPSTINLVQLNELNQDQLLSVQETEWSFQSSLEGFYAKKLGYKIHHLSTNDPQSFWGWMFGDFTRLIVKTSLLRIVEDSPIPINKLWIAKDSKFFKKNINKLLEISNDNESTWTFFYSRPPHPPFIFNKDGTLRDKKEYDQDFATNLTDTWSENTKEMYVNQIEYINTEFLKIFDEIIKSSNIKPIIIIHSDHGIHNFSGSIGEEELNDISEAVINEHFNILTSLYTVDNCRKIAEKDITSVNIIRTILRECFEFDIKNTSDNSYWSHRHKNEFISVKE